MKFDKKLILVGIVTVCLIMVIILLTERHGPGMDSDTKIVIKGGIDELISYL